MWNLKAAPEKWEQYGANIVEAKMEFEVAMTTGEIINARYDKWEKIMEICAIYIYDLFMILVFSLEAFSKNTYSD